MLVGDIPTAYGLSPWVSILLGSGFLVAMLFLYGEPVGAPRKQRRDVTMKTTRLGDTGLEVSRLCLGCMTYGDPHWRSWILGEDEARDALHATPSSSASTSSTPPTCTRKASAKR